jgi:tetratricopeptide (TPR) repeat protein
LAYLRRGLDMYLRTGARVGLIQILIATAEALEKLGRYEEASRTLSEAQELDHASGAGSFAAEAARLQGELLLRQADARPPSRRRRKPSGGDAAPEAEACFLQALAIARQQGARSWELRAATSLAALWNGQGKSREARDLLSGILGRFTEGADTLDVRNARASLAALE